MPRFKNLGAPHTGPDGVTHFRGEEFESDADLDLLFQNKFERLEGKTKKGRDKDDSLDNSGRVMDIDDNQKNNEKQRVKDLKKEKVQTGKHTRGAGIKATDGSRVRGETDEEDLEEDEESTTEAEETDEDAEETADESEDEEDEPKPVPKKKKKKKSKK